MVLKALTHFLRNALNELSYQLLSRGDESLLLTQTLQVVLQRALHMLLAFVQFTLLGLQGAVSLQQLVQGGCSQFPQLQLPFLF